jgi:hypothetical protein
MCENLRGHSGFLDKRGEKTPERVEVVGFMQSLKRDMVEA